MAALFVLNACSIPLPVREIDGQWLGRAEDRIGRDPIKLRLEEVDCEGFLRSGESVDAEHDVRQATLRCDDGQIAELMVARNRDLIQAWDGTILMGADQRRVRLGFEDCMLNRNIRCVALPERETPMVRTE